MSRHASQGLNPVGAAMEADRCQGVGKPGSLLSVPHFHALACLALDSPQSLALPQAWKVHCSNRSRHMNLLFRSSRWSHLPGDAKSGHQQHTLPDLDFHKPWLAHRDAQAQA